MRKITILLLLFTTLISYSQIGNIRVDGSYLKIYNDKGSYITSFYIGQSQLEGYNNDYIIIHDGQYIKIYNNKGSYQSSFYIGKSSIKHVNGSSILIKDGHYVKYYDFKGNYTGYCTYE